VEPRGSRTLQAPITSKFDTQLHPTGVLVKPPRGRTALGSVVLLNPLRAIDKSRLGRRLGSLKPATMTLVNDALAIVLALANI